MCPCVFVAADILQYQSLDAVNKEGTSTCWSSELLRKPTPAIHGCPAFESDYISEAAFQCLPCFLHSFIFFPIINQFLFEIYFL